MNEPRTLERLDDYVSGTMADDDAAAFEEALFGAAAAGEVDFVDRLARGSAFLFERGTFYMGATRRELDALAAKGLRVYVLDLGRPGACEARFEANCDVFVTRLDARLHGIEYVDVEIEIPGHGVLKTMRDVRVDPEDGAIYGACERDLALAAYSGGRTISRVLATRDGRRELVATYDISPIA